MAEDKQVDSEPEAETNEAERSSKGKAKAAKGRVTNGSIISLANVTKTYYRGKEPVEVLKDLDLEIEEGSFEALMGPSGSGKSTLLNLIAGLDSPTSGSVRVAGADLERMGEGARAKWRSQNIGFVFQTYNMLPVLTALENVELPLLLTNLPASERRKRAQTALRIVGLEDRVNHYPRELSGGQEQRVTIARAIVTDPRLIVADEPTGDLDRENAEEILGLLVKLNEEFDKTIIMVTHDPAAADRAKVLRKLDKGALV
jgi:putative ABC transport system ATP-binding protein